MTSDNPEISERKADQPQRWIARARDAVFGRRKPDEGSAKDAKDWRKDFLTS
jgi:hypothetical protein